MRTLTIKNALTWTAYPVVMLVCIGLFMTFRGLGFALLACTSIPIMLGAGSITFLELYNPHIKSWIANKNDVGNDVLFMLTVQMILPELLAFLVAISIASCQLISTLLFLVNTLSLSIFNPGTSTWVILATEPWTLSLSSSAAILSALPAIKVTLLE